MGQGLGWCWRTEKPLWKLSFASLFIRQQPFQAHKLESRAPIELKFTLTKKEILILHIALWDAQIPQQVS